MSETSSLDQFVEQQLQCGKYPSYEAMVEEGLRLLQAQEERDTEAKRIADELNPAYERFKRGEPGLPLDAEDIIRRGRERLATKSSQV